MVKPRMDLSIPLFGTVGLDFPKCGLEVAWMEIGGRNVVFYMSGEKFDTIGSDIVSPGFLLPVTDKADKKRQTTCGMDLKQDRKIHLLTDLYGKSSPVSIASTELVITAHALN